MIKFKSIYKSEYNQILNDNNDSDHLEHDISVNSICSKENFYVFKAKAPITDTWVQTVISGQMRNENERFENTLKCKK